MIWLYKCLEDSLYVLNIFLKVIKVLYCSRQGSYILCVQSRMVLDVENMLIWFYRVSWNKMIIYWLFVLATTELCSVVPSLLTKIAYSQLSMNISRHTINVLCSYMVVTTSDHYMISYDIIHFMHASNT